MKFKVGDRVKVIKQLSELEGGSAYIGEIGTVVVDDDYQPCPYEVEFDKKVNVDVRPIFCDEELEKIEEE